jgi:hypothetical protein
MSVTEAFALVPAIFAILALALLSGGENLFTLKSLGAFGWHWQAEGSMTEFRTETDILGPVEVPADKLWGAQTQRI